MASRLRPRRNRCRAAGTATVNSKSSRPAPRAPPRLQRHRRARRKRTLAERRPLWVEAAPANLVRPADSL
ncbi:hypothetical protein XFF6166_50005 [Xanthomonas citri pv. fuscans]|nr:hypothetical protein XFF6166_50005 [Xanthomonas citri pv. fuscans]SOO04033.1 hypothetical protein XFF7767_210047 [Xanthomonas citri pv. fuscans]SOO09187.1 hypothetical protein XFF6970_320044 [Xanthomonas citri pv. fuscans]SOO44727.1 hypothetical protein XFF1815_620005 [Xanthomonas citri pv. fuscans]